MNEKYIRKLIRLVEESEIESLEVSSWGRKIRITQKHAPYTNGHSNTGAIVQPSYNPQPSAPQASAPTPAPAAQPQVVLAPAEDISKLVEIKSPMVGTFYSAASPDVDPYVSLNEKVNAGQVICVVEAMKLMNEIEAEVSGRVVKIFAQNGKPVEFGQALFLIDPNG
ncbi:MAG: acetyl-CoA carboxylase biotin carboxyl carrier protein [candidate division Zixibacteria bacterium]|nr:acetyl-CoA carboxylase biotin carboxyl carrier protein [candidate division Zixibacteria bacterium]